MGFYQFTKTQKVFAPVEKVWDFISRPENLKLITPAYMGFDITSKNVPSQMYRGMIVSYKVSPLPGFKTTWVTEITQLEENKYFVDEQRVGPYNLWHHQHLLEQKDDHTLMTDIVSYRPPFYFLGDIANQLLIKSKLKEIFEYRTQAVDRIFNREN